MRFWLGILALAMISCAVDDRTEVTFARLGATGCAAGKPLMWIRPGLSPAVAHIVFRHEMVHVKALLASPLGCEEYLAFIKARPLRELDFEATAYCAAALFAANQYGVDYYSTIQHDMQNMYLYFEGAVSYTDVRAAFGRYCPAEQ